jgi:hypothetical protein
MPVSTPWQLHEYLRAHGLVDSISEHKDADGNIDGVIFTFTMPLRGNVMSVWYPNKDLCEAARQRGIAAGQLPDSSGLN